MASIDVGSERSGRKSVDANVPLIPFIDLLLCCIMFLLVTAVWNQLASHDLVLDLPNQRAPDSAQPEVVRLVLQLQQDGYVLSSTAGDHFEIPKVAGAYDQAALRERLAAYRSADPSQQELTLAADDGVIYDAVVQAMDAAAAQGFTTLSFSGG